MQGYLNFFLFMIEALRDIMIMLVCCDALTSWLTITGKGKVEVCDHLG